MRSMYADDPQGTDWQLIGVRVAFFGLELAGLLMIALGPFAVGFALLMGAAIVLVAWDWYLSKRGLGRGITWWPRRR